MHIKAVSTKLSILLIAITLLAASCSGGGSSSNTMTNGTQSTGTSEGSKTGPVVLSLSSPHSASIASIGTDYYTFTTSSAGSYGITLLNSPTDVSWDLFSSSDYSSTFVTSCDNMFTGPENEVCSTTLSANTKYYLRVNNWDNAVGSFVATVAFLDPSGGCGSSGTCVNFENGGVPSSFVMSGNALWTIDSTTAASGAKSFRSGAITDSQISCFAYTPSGTSQIIIFSLKTDSEQYMDTLKFYIDGNVQTSSWSGSTPWMRVIFGTMAGNHTYKWCYIKDPSISVGADAVWVDDIEIQ